MWNSRLACKAAQSDKGLSYTSIRSDQLAKGHNQIRVFTIQVSNHMAKGAPTEEKMQKSVDQVSDSCDSYELTISIKKTDVVYQPAPGKP